MRKLNRSKSILKTNNVKIIENSQKLRIRGGCTQETPVVAGHTDIHIVDVEDH
ncbi:MAG: hypothetical protein AAFP19_10530 [Bacteroidota bacterium]